MGGDGILDGLDIGELRFRLGLKSDLGEVLDHNSSGSSLSSRHCTNECRRCNCQARFTREEEEESLKRTRERGEAGGDGSKKKVPAPTKLLLFIPT